MFGGVGVWSECVYVNHIQAWYLQRPEEYIESQGPEVRDGCELACGCRDLNTVVDIVWKSSLCS